MYHPFYDANGGYDKRDIDDVTCGLFVLTMMAENGSTDRNLIKQSKIGR